MTGLRGGVGFVGVNGLGRRTQVADRNNWDPRIGLAYELNVKTAIRTGFGVFTSSIAPNNDAALGFSATTNSLVSQADGVQYNQLPDQYLSLGTQLNATVTNPFFGIITEPTSTLSRSTIQRGQLLRPFPQFTGASASQAPVGHSTYHAMQIRVERPFADGLALLFAYTHSKLIDNVGDFGTFLGPAGFNNNNCFACDRALSFYDIPDVVPLSLRYELPFGVGKPHVNKGVMARVVGGWSTGVYYTWDNGTPVQLTNPNDSNSFGGAARPNATGETGGISNPTLQDGAVYFNKNAFVRAPQFTFGNVSRNLSLDFRTELFNAFNNVVFSGPQTSITSADFGLIRLLQANVPRQIQFGLRFSY